MKRFFLGFFVLMSSWRLSAMEITFEPYLGPYLFGTYEEGSSNSLSGFGIGAKAGVFFANAFLAGLELSTAGLSADTSPETDHEQQGVGLFGGMLVPGLPVRGWLTYYPVYLDRISGGRRLDGSAIKLGMGIAPFPVLPISFNIEYLMATFSEQRNGGTATKMNPEGSSQNLLFNVSFPLSTPL